MKTQGTSEEDLAAFVDAVLEESVLLGGDAPMLNAVDLLCLIFDVADVREGKGERGLFVKLLLMFAQHFPTTAVAALALVPTFASWRTLNLIADDAAVLAASVPTTTPEDAAYAHTLQATVSEVVRLYATQLRADDDALKAWSSAGGECAAPTLTLAGKWAPSSTSRFERGTGLATRIREALFPLTVSSTVMAAAAAGDADASRRVDRGVGPRVPVPRVLVPVPVPVRRQQREHAIVLGGEQRVQHHGLAVFACHVF